MQTTTYIVYPKAKDGASPSIKVKASGYSVVGNGERVTFEDGGTQIAVFNLSELTGFVRAENVVNG